MIRTRRPKSLMFDAGVLIAATALTTIVGARMHGNMLDDAFITYNHARNFARFGKLLYSPGTPYLTTTAPLYAILLGVAGRLGLDIPSFSNILGAVSLLVAGICLYMLARRHGRPLTGAVAAILVVSSPLMWLTLGLETCFWIALICGMFYVYDREQYVGAGLLAGLAVLTRADAALPIGIMAFHHVLIARRRVSWKAVIAFAAVVAPVLVYLVVLFGSPIPATLQAKQAQVQLGITGFEIKTTLMQGLEIMLRGWLSQSWFYLLWVPVLALGLVILSRFRWAWNIVAWGIVHLVAYLILRVTPYLWYYGALVPAAALLAGLAFDWLVVLLQRLRLWPVLASVLLICLVLPQTISLRYSAAYLDGSFRSPPDVMAKVLPYDGGYMYHKIGSWLNKSTPEAAVVAVTEVGIIGYYADRPMVDFLGILQPDVAMALQRDDLFYAIPQYMPDYIVLGSNLDTFGARFDKDRWFLSNYRPLTVIPTDGIGAEPQTIVERISPRAPMIDREAGITFTSGLTLKSFGVDETRLQPGNGLRVRLDWVRTKEMSGKILVIAYLDDQDGKMAALGEHEIDTSLLRSNQVSPMFHLIYLDKALLPGPYSLGLRMVLADQTNIIRPLATFPVTARVETH